MLITYQYLQIIRAMYADNNDDMIKFETSLSVVYDVTRGTEWWGYSLCITYKTSQNVQLQDYP